MASGQSNLERFQAEGFTFQTPLPPEYEEVVEGLSSEEVELLIGIKQRFDDAHAQVGGDVGHPNAYVGWPF